MRTHPGKLTNQSDAHDDEEVEVGHALELLKEVPRKKSQDGVLGAHHLVVAKRVCDEWENTETESRKPDG